MHELYGDPEVVDAVVERWGDEVAPGRRGRPRRRGPPRVRRRRPSASGSRACCGRGSARACRRGPRGARTAGAAAGARRRGAAAVRVRHGAAPSTRRSPSSPTRTSARNAPARAATRRSTSGPVAPAHPGGEGRARHLRCAQRRHARGPRGRPVRRPRQTDPPVSTRSDQRPPSRARAAARPAPGRRAGAPARARALRRRLGLLLAVVVLGDRGGGRLSRRGSTRPCRSSRCRCATRTSSASRPPTRAWTRR